VHAFALAKAGDRMAMEELWAAHCPWIAAIIAIHKPKTSETADILQDVATSFVTKVHTVESSEALASWLRQVAINAARLAGRKVEIRTRHAHIYQSLQSEAFSSGATPEADSALAGHAQVVIELTRQLPPEYGEVLMLRAVQGLSYRAISEITGLTQSTIETRIARARRMLRELVRTNEKTQDLRDALKISPGQSSARI
jgi:RNA polymerase sigma-70 factor, ECF subfamily